MQAFRDCASEKWELFARRVQKPTKAKTFLLGGKFCVEEKVCGKQKGGEGPSFPSSSRRNVFFFGNYLALA